MSYKRPTGVIVISVLSILGGLGHLLIGLIAGIFTAFAGKAVEDITGAPEGIETAVALIILGSIMIMIVGILWIVSGIGIFILKEWARKLAIWMAGVSILWNILGMAHVAGFPTVNISAGIIGIIIAALVIWYLFKSSTVAVFSSAEEE